MDWLIKSIVVLVSVFVFVKIALLYFNSKKDLSQNPAKLPLLFTGFIANVADTLGLGSFAVVVAFNNRWKFVDDKSLPGTLNAHSVLPAMLQSILFLNFVDMDISLLVLFVLAACVGGLLSGFLVSKLDKQSIRLIMTFGFIGISLLIFCNQLNLLPVGGDATSLPLAKLMIGIPAMMLAGMLPAIGAGIYVPIQVILFFLGLSPLVAYPIMTTAGAIVQSTTAYAFVAKKEVAIEESLLLALSGLVGVAIAVPLITYVNLTTLRWLLLVIVIYNAVMMRKAYLREKTRPVEAH
jgi:uncharacterized membrane protein YfcA